MSSGRWIGFARSSSRRQVSTWSGSHSESPIGLPWAARNVKHMPPPMTSASTDAEQGVDHARACR